MPYRFTNIIDAKSYLESLGFTVGISFMNWITPLRSSSKRSNLMYGGTEVGYLETPTDLQPDEDWCVNIPFEKRSLIPSGVLNAIFGNTGGNEGWENRQFYIETNNFTRFKFGNELQHTIIATGPNSTLNLKSASSALSIYKEPSGGAYNAVMALDMPEMAQLLRFEFAEILQDVAMYRPNPTHFNIDGAHPGYIISIDNNHNCKWMPASSLILGTVPEAINAQKLNGLNADEYLSSANLTEKLMEIVSNNVEDGVTVTASNDRLHFVANDFTIRLAGTIQGEGTVNSLGDVVINTTGDNSNHNHDNKYVLLAGGSIIDGSVGSSKYISELGTANGLCFTSDPTNISTMRSQIYTHWNAGLINNQLVIRVVDNTNDDIIIDSGKDLKLDSTNIILDSASLTENYNYKTEIGESYILDVDEVNVTSDNVGITTSNDIVIQANNNVSLTAIEDETLMAKNLTLTTTSGDIQLTTSAELYERSTTHTIETDNYDLTSNTNIVLKSLNKVVVKAPEAFIVNDTESAVFDLDMVDGGFRVDVNIAKFNINTFQINANSAISINTSGPIPVNFNGGYVLTSSSVTENIQTAKIINAPAINYNCGSFYVNSPNTTFSGGDATFANDVYINGSLHLTGGGTSGSSLSTEDKFLVLNANETGAGVSSPGTSGIEIDRGSSSNVRLYWDESTTAFKIIDHMGVPYKVLTQNDVSALNNNYVNIAGSTMTGALLLNADPVNDLGAATKQYVDDFIYDHDSEHDDRFVQLTGSTLTGVLTLYADPINNLEATTKQYVDNVISDHDIQHTDTFLQLTGGTLTGAVNIAYTPTNNADLVHKEYVDNALGSRKKGQVIGDGVATEFTVTHNWGTKFIFVSVWDTTTYDEVTCSIQHTDLNYIKLFFDTAPATDSLIVTMIR